MLPSIAGEALGVKYDELYLVRLKNSSKVVSHHDFFTAEGKPSPIVLESLKVNSRWHKKVDTLFHSDQDFDNGNNDCLLQLFSFVFYNEGKIVMSITPNLLGSDLYVSDRKIDDFRSFSEKQMKEFLEVVFLSIRRQAERAVLPINKVSEQVAAPDH
ncbi:hypothetical protein HW115_19460 [Verrucomicrobiaceae bacterium N1E253]|uniref:Uncharacterized protein n=1 Tax=Oceaniferula marina TaxID=2748318 RepID=A0A851GKD9_9BACT|nr:hypothetical protein [Oceaniferula marina]NWK57806.1 hypothetical protein [Oceaniferula marina]